MAGIIRITHRASFWWLLAALAALATGAFVSACDTEADVEDVDRSEEAEPSALVCGVDYDEKIQPFFDAYCLRCHGEAVPASQRHGAPDALNFDTMEMVLANGEAVRASLLDNSGQPPSPPYPTHMERDVVLSWIDCAMDETAEP
ncbi:MAG: hypothetical protein M5R36_06960 [Deltaproteobacteria bacterium]|nr:hypothetical protein [Deltaproteobacteria bacterium]